MANYNTKLTKARSKIERLGLAGEAMKLKAKGLGSIKIARALTSLTKGVSVNATNVDNFFKGLKNVVDRNEQTVKRAETQLAENKLIIMGHWEKLDRQLDKLLHEASNIQTRILQTKQGPVEMQYKDLRLWKDVLVDIAKITEIRARILGQLKSGIQVHITNIEHQYNDLKQIIIEADKKFPGLLKHVDELLELE